MLILLGMVNDFIPQPPKAFLLMVVTLLGIDKDVRFLQFQKAYSPMEVTPSGILTEDKLSQSSNRHPSIVVILSGNVTVVNLLQYTKAL